MGGVFTIEKTFRSPVEKLSLQVEASHADVKPGSGVARTLVEFV